MADGLWQTSTILLRSRIRAQLSYRLNFSVTFLSAFLVGVLEFTELYVLLSRAPTLGGLTLLQASLVFAMANLSFSLADLIAGELDKIPQYLRLGTLDAFLVRPLPLLLQLVTAEFQLRRLGRLILGVLVLVVVLTRLDFELTAGNVYLLIMTPLYGAVIFSGLFVIAGGVQFYVIEGSEFTNAFVYGGSYAGQLPGSVLLTPLRIVFTFVFPATVVAYLPALLIMDLPGPAWLPVGLGWAGPLFAGWTWLLAMLVWRSGLRHYTGAGG